eukprot:m.117591 g.117591  ORF g.117591 m.117591 type:complete len:117 (-) comp15547_c0_seq28:1564-1914(-)
MDFFRSVSDFFAGTGQRDTFVGSRISLGGVVLDVEAAIAEGGFGIVYKCRDDANKLYALKKMLAHDHSHMKPIRREIETIRRIWREGMFAILGCWPVVDGYDSRGSRQHHSAYTSS